MKAAVVHSFDQPLEIEDVPIPEPGAGQVLVRIEASGLCHTDIHAARGEWPVKPSPPFIPGHEGVGIIERLGDGRRPRPGAGHARRAAVARLRVRRLPLLQQRLGDAVRASSTPATRMNGGFAEYAVGYARHVVRVPDGIDAARRGAAHVRRRDHLQGGQGLGRRLVRASSPSSAPAASATSPSSTRAITGASVVAVDINDERLRVARERWRRARDQPARAGPGRGDPGSSAAPTPAIATAVNPIAFEQALGSLARGGTLVCVGLPADNDMKLPIFETVLGGLTIKGSIVGTHHDLEEVFELHRRGLTTVEHAERRARRRQRGDRAGARRQRPGAAARLPAVRLPPSRP